MVIPEPREHRPATLPNAGDLELAIHLALQAHDMPAVVGLLKLMAAVDVRRAARLYDLLQLALAVRESEATASEPVPVEETPK